MIKILKEILGFLSYLNYGIESKNPYQKKYVSNEKDQPYKFAK